MTIYVWLGFVKFSNCTLVIVLLELKAPLGYLKSCEDILARHIYLYSTYHTQCYFKVLYIKEMNN